MGLATTLVLAALALAGPGKEGWYLEGPAASSRSEASALVKAAHAEGHKARVVRRFRHGGGWEFVPVVEGFEAAEGASEAARSLADRTGRSLVVYTFSGDEARPVGEVTATAAEADESEEDASESEEAAVEDLLRAAISAHGGPDGGLARLAAADAVLFRYRRTVPGGPVVEHTWARGGEGTYLEIAVVEGEGTPSRTWARESGAWLQVEDAAPTPQDLERTRETVARFGPEETLAFPLGFAAATRTRRELQLLYQDGVTAVGGHACRRLRFDGDQGAGSLELALDAETHRVRQVRFGNDGGEVRHEFDGYEEVAPGVVLPRTIRTWHGEDLVDEVEVLELDLDPHLPEAWVRDPTP